MRNQYDAISVIFYRPEISGDFPTRSRRFLPSVRFITFFFFLFSSVNSNHICRERMNSAPTTTSSIFPALFRKPSDVNAVLLPLGNTSGLHHKVASRVPFKKTETRAKALRNSNVKRRLFDRVRRNAQLARNDLMPGTRIAFSVCDNTDAGRVITESYSMRVERGCLTTGNPLQEDEFPSVSSPPHFADSSSDDSDD